MADLTSSVLVTVLIAVLFAVVAALLIEGARRTGRWTTVRVPVHGRQTNVRLEIVWTGISTLLLFGIFLYVH